MTIRVVDGAYEVVCSSLLHTHTFHVGKSWLYVRNRRLSPLEEEEVYEAMDGLKGVHGVKAFALERFHKHLKWEDARSIILRRNKTQSQNGEIWTEI